MSRPSSLERLQETVLRGGDSSYVARGLGRSYGDPALNRDAGVLVQTALRRIVAFDAERGVIECEGGVSLEQIILHALPAGWFLPTSPGTKFVTVGGAIAADVHGKNHHAAGSFGRFVEALTLLLASGELLRCSPTEHPELFWATVGGMGLTGVIVSARVRLHRVETSYFRVTHRRNKDLDESLSCLQETDRAHRYSVAWIDCLASGRSLGRSVLMLANDGRADDLPPRLRRRPLALPRRLKKPVPFDLPGWTLNRLTVKAFNAAYFALHGDRERYEDYDEFFYPLDSVLRWNRIYGRRGFVQYQALLPRESARAGLIALLERIARSGRASFLAVLKSSGEASPAPLSYLYPGTTLALDFPNAPGLRELTDELDQLLLRHGGRLYLAKDSMMRAETFRAMYPRLDEFRAVKARFDPNQRFSSSQARRLGICEA